MPESCAQPVPFRGSRALALMCRDPGCEREAEVLALGSGEACCPREEWCLEHYEPRRKVTDCVYRLVREPQTLSPIRHDKE